MNKGSAAIKCVPMSKKVSNVNNVSYNRNCKGSQRPGRVLTHSQELRELSLLTISTSSVTPRSHQRRWSADLSKSETSPVVVVKKNKKEPQPPQRGVSLRTSHTVSYSSFKRYSCPPLGMFTSQSQSSSSSSSTTSSCSSPPPVKTSVITGHDPLGWKLHPKSSSTSARTKRLSLQIPLPVIFPDPKSSPSATSPSDNTPNEDPAPKTKPPLRPKPFRRHHSESSAFLRSLANPLPVVTLEELCAIRLRPVSHSDESDDVFIEGHEEKVKVTSQPRKIPPPVPEKTFMARQIAQLIARSSKHTHQTVDHSSLHVKKMGLRLDTSCDRERPSPRFPGREI
ncbi:putative protein TPRXL isoform X2 [Toxotes jaculatrix]|uniref:putative protein TPRXL isoform X2 n=1 Tax=Toxotes jaculatrix TaxID=941984 RepID=UPI001B3A93BF|nr:putative protein TPRXL isoform X2 [Toxotes jaculatrix]